MHNFFPFRYIHIYIYLTHLSSGLRFVQSIFKKTPQIQPEYYEFRNFSKHSDLDRTFDLNLHSNRANINSRMPDEQFCLRWNNHHPNLISVFSSLLQNDQMVDVTLISDNREIHAHKIVLSACSPFFQVINFTNQPRFFFHFIPTKICVFTLVEYLLAKCMQTSSNCFDWHQIHPY